MRPRDEPIIMKPAAEVKWFPLSVRVLKQSRECNAHGEMVMPNGEPNPIASGIIIAL
jgi:hypothetical protein